MQTPPPPPADLRGFEPDPDEEARPGQRRYVWTKEQIERADCTLVDLGAVYERCNAAKEFPIDRIRLRLCVRHGAKSHVLSDMPLEPNLTREEVALTYGCSPLRATTQSNLCYQVEVWGVSETTGAFSKRISQSRDNCFVIGPDEAPIRKWTLRDGQNKGEPDKQLQDEVKYRERMNGRHAVTQEPWEAGGDDAPPQFHGRAVPPMGMPHGGGEYDVEDAGEDVDDQVASPMRPMRPSFLGPQRMQDMRPSPPGPNGEDLWIPQQGWAFSAGRRAEMERARQEEERRKADAEKFEALARQNEELRRALEKDRADRLAAEERARQEAERRDMLARIAEAERKAEEARREAEQKAEAVRREMERRQEEALRALQRQPSIAEDIAKLAPAFAPLLTILTEQRAAERAAELRRADREAEDRKAERARQEAEAQRRADREAEDRKAERARQEMEAQRREDQAREDRKTMLALMTKPAPSVPPELLSQIRALEQRVEESHRRSQREGTRESKDGFIAEMERLAKVRDLLDKLQGGEGGSESTMDTIKDLVKEGAPVLEPVVRSIFDRMQARDKREELRELREEQRQDRREAREASAPRRPGYIEGAGGTLQPVERAQLSSGITIEVPADFVAISDGQLVHVSQYPAFVEQRTRVRFAEDLNARHRDEAYAAAEESWRRSQTSREPDGAAAVEAPMAPPEFSPVATDAPAAMGFSTATASEPEVIGVAPARIERRAQTSGQLSMDFRSEPSGSSAPATTATTSGMRGRLAGLRAVRYEPKSSAPVPVAAPAAEIPTLPEAGIATMVQESTENGGDSVAGS